MDSKDKVGELLITKELFTEVMNALRKQQEIDAKCDAAICSVFPDATVAIYDHSKVSNSLVGLLQKAMNDEHVESWIEYYMYELDFGQKYRKGCVKDKDGSNIKLATAEDLYNLLIS